MSRNPEDLVRLSEAEADRLARLYMEAEREILLQVDRAMTRGNDLRYLRGMLDNVQGILEDLLTGNRQWCEQAIPRVYVAGAEYASQMVGKAIAGFGAVHQQAVKVLADNTFDRLENVRQVIGRRTEDVYRQYALEATRQSIIGYKSWQEVAKDFRANMRAEGITGFTDAAGRKWNMKTYAETVARTTTMQAHLEGTANRLVEHGYDLVLVSSHPGSCEKCLPYQGKILSITGKTPGYPTLQEAKDNGLFHPRCRHAFSLHIDLDAEIEALEKELGEESTGVSQKGTPESPKNGAEKKLPTLSGGVPMPSIPDAAKPAVTQAIRTSLEHGLKTGHEHLLTLNATDGGEIHPEIEGGSEHTAFPDTLMNLLKVAPEKSIVMVHNHSNNSSFSDDDVTKLAEFSSVKGMLVVGHNGKQYYIGKTDRTPALRESRLRAEYQRLLLKYFGKYNEPVKSGAMTADEAWAEHSHEILRDLAKSFKLEYARWGGQ